VLRGMCRNGRYTGHGTTSMLDGGRCTYPGGPAPSGAQLAQAETFLKAHALAQAHLLEGNPLAEGVRRAASVS
jgi:hypothetical protein